MSVKDKIKSRETWYFELAYRIVQGIRGANMPAFRLVYWPLGKLRRIGKAAWRRFKNFLFNEPIFVTYCESCGSGLQLYDDLPNFIGRRVRLVVGTNVRIEGDMTILGGHVFDSPEFKIGDDTYLGYQTQVFVGDRIEVGSNVLIANRVTLLGYDSHPIDPVDRAANEPPDESGCGPIIVEDYAWLCSNSIILKGVTIGRGSIVATGAVVTRDVPELTIVAGNPARVVKEIPLPEEWEAR